MKITVQSLTEGNLALDLVNTEEIRRGIQHDFIKSAEDFSVWLSNEELAGAVSKTQMPFEVEVWSSKRMENVHQLRAEVRGHLEPVSQGEEIDPQFVARLEVYIERAPLSIKVYQGNIIFVPVGDPFEKLCSLVAIDILKLIGDGRIERLRKCENPKCQFMFIDTSGRRKWCSMQRCGNRAKVAKHLRRKTEG
ncbi:MAG: CGNR zinc finger domain-containing protein [Alicyclobacillus sp.]|nr:CGNR zinc finger domain-containing protein [Alicyclobacillus sp.]